MKILRHFSIGMMSIAVACLLPVTGSAGHSDTEISTSLDQLAGVWSSEGYGQIVEIINGSPMRFDRFQISEESCLLIDSGPLEYFYSDLAHVLRNADGTRFSYMLSGNLTTYAFNRLSALPAQCSNGGTGPDSDPLVNFDVLWATFNEQYAFFAQRGVNWTARREAIRPRLNSASSDEDLFDALVSLVTPLCDGHVEIASSFAEFNGVLNPDCSGENILYQEILDEFGGQSTITDPFEFFQQVFRPSVLQIIEDNYLARQLTSAARDKIFWGELSSNVGYMSILQMTNYAGPNATPAEDLEVLAPVLDEALASFAGKDALVIDVRLNTGGYDHVAMDLASRFADQPRVAFTKKARWDDGFTTKRAHVIKPSGDIQFTRPIVILTSTFTASAAENFLLAMRVLPHVTIIGETTVGVHSDVLQRRLPNGWLFTLSNEIYEAPDGTLFEGRGITPAIEVAALRAEDRALGRDTGIEAALGQLATGSIDPGLRGTWWNPGRSGEGYMFDYLMVGANRYLFVTFYTYDENGNQAYLVGSTTEISNPLSVNVGLTEGGIFGSDYDPGDQNFLPWGTLTVDFHNCMESTVSLDPEMPGFAGYSTNLERYGDSPFEGVDCP
jgi:hypothetical protein